MAFNATTVWEVRTTGATANGGAFDPGVASPGTDFSKQDAAQVAYTDIVIDGATNTKCTSAAHAFDSTSPGNFINISAGTGFTVQTVEILSVAAGVATCDKSLGTLGSTGGTGNLGGAVLDPAITAGLMVGGNTMFIKSGTYTINSTSSNVAGGRIATPAGTATNPTAIIGYTTNRAAGNTDTRPLLQASTVTALTLITVPASGNHYIDNLALDGAALGTSRGIDATASSNASVVIHCKFSNFTSVGFNGATSSLAILCEGTSNSSNSFAGSTCYCCVAHDNTSSGFNSSGDSATFYGCLSCNNSGATSDGFLMSTPMLGCINCTSYNNGRDGFRITSGASGFNLIGCIAEGNAGWGYRGSAATGNIRLINSGGKADGLGLVDTTTVTATQVGTITATAEIFVNVAGNDFRLNNDPNGGSLFKGVGVPGATLTTKLQGFSNLLGFVDCGALQHQDVIPPGVLFQAGSVIAGS